MRSSSTTSRPPGVRRALLAAAAWAAFAHSAVAQTAPSAAQGYLLYQFGVPGKPACAVCHGPDPDTSSNPLWKAKGNPDYLLTAWSMVPMKQYDFASVIDENGRAAIAQYLLYPAAGTQAYSQLSLQTVAFGDVAVGQPQHRSVVLTNIGATSLTGIVLQANPSAVGVTASDDCPAGGLAAGASCTVTVTFDPRAAGVAGAVYVVHATQDASTTSQFIVTGNGTDGGATNPQPVGGGGAVSSADLAGLGLTLVALALLRRRPA